jgi:hypothetical protein
MATVPPVPSSTSTTAMASATCARTTAATSSPVTSTVSAAVTSTVSATIARGWRVDPIEIRLVAFIELSSAFERQGGSCADRNRLSLGLRLAIDWSRRRWRCGTTAHLCTLFFKNCFARETDAVAFYG